LPDCESVTDGWLLWPVGQWIADHGLEYFDESMLTMVALTKRFSSEYAVRPFVEYRPQGTFTDLVSLTKDDSAHVRRWCSEAVRPRLSWGKKLHALVCDPTPIFPILEALKDDDELYVRRCVANNSNDIAKDHAAMVVSCCGRWLAPVAGESPRTWVIKYGLRTLIEARDPDALAMIGFTAPHALHVALDTSPTEVHLGDWATLRATVSSSANNPQAPPIDYVVDYVRQRGKYSAKVFKWTRVQLHPGESVTVEKRRPMRVTSVRALYPREHRVRVQINGRPFAQSSFVLR
jgi:3-methyladenine DNA glycosylase AlkC